MGDLFEVERAFPTAVEYLLSQHESQRLDFKSKRIKPASLAKTLCAFANADGGEVYVGIEDNKEWAGFQDLEEANQFVDLASQIFPLADYLNGYFVECEGQNGFVLKFEVSRTPDVKRTTSGDVYIRFGAQNLNKSDEKSLKQLEYSKGVYSYEDETLRSSLDDIENSKAIINFSLNIVPHPEPEVWLRKQKLIVNENGTVAANILFADEPQVNIPKSGVKLY